MAPPERLKLAVRGLAAFFAAIVVIRAIVALLNLDFADSNWWNELGQHAVALLLATIAVAIAISLIFESLKNADETIDS